MRGRGVDGLAKAQGAARYVGDAVPRPHVFAAVLRSRLAHSRVRVDRAALQALPGILKVLAHADEPQLTYTTNPHGGTADTDVFAAEARFPGDIVGAIAATDRASLRAALTRAPEFIAEEPLPAVLSLAAGLEREVIAHPGYPDNLILDLRVGHSPAEVEQALEQAPFRHVSTVSFDPTPHGFLEPLAAGARWDENRWQVWSPTQCPALVRDQLTELFAAEVVLEPVYLGGGFGGKEELTLEPAAMLLSAALGGVAVLVETTRREMTTSYRTRHGGTITVKTGFDAEGIFTARSIEVLFAAGPYDGHSTTVTSNALQTAARLYPRGVVGGRARAVVTNHVPGGAYRGYGGTQGAFAIETHVDQIAEKLGIDPLELRLRNVAQTGDIDPGSGMPMHAIRARDCLQMLEKLVPVPVEQAEASHLRTGRGMAVVVNTSAAAGVDHPDHAEVACALDPATGRLTIETSVAEAGQGMYPMLAAVVSEALSMNPAQLTVAYSASKDAPADHGMFGSRGANVTGSAALRAARTLLDEVRRQAAVLLATTASDVAIDPDWTFCNSRRTGAVVKLAELAPIRILGSYATADPGYAYGVTLAEVTCDLRTGDVWVDRVVAVHDMGVVLDPEGARAQIEGGALHFVGMALSEHVTVRADGTVAETGFVNHLMPTAVRRPRVEAHFLSAPEHRADRTGAKGIGEAAVVGGPAAIENALAAAIGMHVGQMPMTPERVLRKLEAGSSNGAFG
jgi:CO/xanthine dehydrogenase Mo-binding subunit